MKFVILFIISLTLFLNAIIFVIVKNKKIKRIKILAEHNRGRQADLKSIENKLGFGPYRLLYFFEAPNKKGDNKYKTVSGLICSCEYSELILLFKLVFKNDEEIKIGNEYILFRSPNQKILYLAKKK